MRHWMQLCESESGDDDQRYLEVKAYLAALPPRKLAMLWAEIAHQRKLEWLARRDEEADRLTREMDMTPEGYVFEWDKHGRQTSEPMPAWEWAYRRRDLIVAAQRAGYIHIGNDVRGTITLEPEGMKLLRTLHQLY